MVFVLTKLSRSFTIKSGVCPVIRPIHFPRFPQREYRLNCESHSRFAYSDSLVLAIMRYPRRGVELGVDAMAAPGCDDSTVSRLGMFLDDVAKVSYWRAGFDKLDCHIQAFPCRLNYSDGVWVSLGSIAHIIRFVEVGVITLVI